MNRARALVFVALFAIALAPPAASQSSTVSCGSPVRCSLGDGDASRAPYVDANGLLWAYAYAAADGAPSSQWASSPNSCTSSGVCWVGDVQLQGTNNPTANPVAWKVLDNQPLPRGPNISFVPNGASYYNYSHDYANGPINFTTSGLNKDNLYVRVVANFTASGQTTAYATGWTRAFVGAPSSALQMTFPANNATAFLGPLSATKFNVTFAQTHTAAPTLDATLFAVSGRDAGLYLNPRTTDFSTSPDDSVTASISPRFPASGGGSTFYYNFSEGHGLSRGQYILNLTVIDNDDPNHRPLAAVSRFFAVETFDPEDSPPIFVPASQAEIHGQEFVNRSFNLTFRVDHGFASMWRQNITSTLVASNKAGPGTRVVQNGSEGFTAVVRDFALNEPRSASWANLSVTLPSNATSGDTFALRVNATVNATSVLNGKSNNSTVLLPLVLDLQPPAYDVYYGDWPQGSNGSGNVLHDPVTIRGFAADTGSGVGELQVRIVNLNLSQTYVPGTGYVAGTQVDAWLTWNYTVTDTQPISFGGNGDWTITSPDNPSSFLDRGYSYRVDVRAHDRLNRSFSPAVSREVHFDTIAPDVRQNLGGLGANATAGVPWHDANPSHVLSVTVHDNNCPARVFLAGTTPSGTAVPPARFSPPDNYICGDGEYPFTLALADHPEATSDVGTYHYKVRVEDTWGNSFTSTAAYDVTVLDTQPALVQFLSLDPTQSAAGGRSTVVAQIFENAGIRSVNVTLAEILSGSRVCDARLNVTERCAFAVGAAHRVNASANGTGTWAAASDADLHVVLRRGSYVWTVRAEDNNSAVTCAANGCSFQTIVLFVGDESFPSIVQDAPAAGVRVVNASPTFRWRALGSGIATFDIHVDAGNNSTSLDEVGAGLVTKAPLPAAANGNATGFAVTFSPGPINTTANTTNLSVRIRVVTPTGQVVSSQVNYTVDATPPNVTANATNLTVVGNKTWATSKTHVTINATDNETTPTVTYTVNGAATPTLYAAPFAPAGPDGNWTLDYVARDGGGNAANGTLRLDLDATPPAIAVVKDGDEIVLTVTDATVGVDENNVTVYYAYGTAGFTPVKAEKVTANNTFRVNLTGNASATGLKYYFEALDLAGNLGTKFSAAAPFVFVANETKNLPPIVTLTSPKEGDVLRGQVTVGWLAEDPENGTNVSITITLRSPSGGGMLPLIRGANNGTHVVNLSALEVGAYALLVSASDGEQTGEAEANVTVAPVVPVVVQEAPPESVAAGEEARFSVTFQSGGKPISGATYTVRRDGAVVATGPLELRQGAYAGAFTPTKPGTYVVSVAPTYADGTTEPSVAIATFSVARGPFPVSLMVLLALAALTVVAAAYGAFVRWSR